MMDIVKEISQRKWSRGSILASTGTINSLPKGEYVVISHDCDILHHSLDDEPNIEVMRLKAIPSVDGNFTNGKNIRKLHIISNCNETHYELNAKDHYKISKENFNAINPSFKLNEKAIDLIIMWRKG